MTGLTPFIIAMIRTDPAKLAKASADALARKYDIPPHFAAFYLDNWRQRA